MFLRHGGHWLTLLGRLTLRPNSTLRMHQESCTSVMQHLGGQWNHEMEANLGCIVRHRKGTVTVTDTHTDTHTYKEYNTYKKNKE